MSWTSRVWLRSHLLGLCHALPRWLVERSPGEWPAAEDPTYHFQPHALQPEGLQDASWISHIYWKGNALCLTPSSTERGQRPLGDLCGVGNWPRL